MFFCKQYKLLAINRMIWKEKGWIMAIIELKEVGKIYATADAVAVGIRRVNAKFDIGEFVAVTGKSGCGKTTMLNVMSGLDTYEEGEIFIDGGETSHFIASDWEEYRKDYISFIFQDYNIIESFTVLQNVEFALTHINDLAERKAKAKELIKKVGLTSVIKQKGSKLSGGQKQRTVIARALAKDSPIILADEPTGNLDSRAAKSIIAILGEISKEKLVVVVTHNIAELEGYATREIRIFDGEIASDEILMDRKIGKSAQSVELVPPTDDIIPSQSNKNAIIIKKKVKERMLITRDSMNLGFMRYLSMPKLTSFMTMMCIIASLGMLLLFSVFLTLTEEYRFDSAMFNYEDGRLIVAQEDRNVVSDVEKQKIADRYGATYRDRDSLDDMNYVIATMQTSRKANRYPKIYNEKFSMSKYDNHEISHGRAPEADDEVMLRLPYHYKSSILEGDKILSDICIMEYRYDIVGIDFYVDNIIQPEIMFSDSAYTDAYVRAVAGGYLGSSKNKVLISPGLEGNEAFDIRIDYDNGATFEMIETLDFAGNTYVVEEYKSIDTSNMNDFLQEGDFVSFAYTHYVEGIYISEELANKIADDLDYQFSLLFENDEAALGSIDAIVAEGFNVAMSSSQMKDHPMEAGMMMSKFVMMLLFAISVLFFGLFVGICSSRVHGSQKKNIAIFRTMGVNPKVVKNSTLWFNLITLVPSMIISIGLIIPLFYTSAGSVFTFIQWWGYFVVFLGMLGIMSIATKVINRRLFRETVRKNLKGGRTE